MPCKPPLSEYYRPRRFNDFWNKSGPVEILQKCILRDRLPKAICLVGTYGTGKTSLARVISKHVNCISPINHDFCGECAGCKYSENLNNPACPTYYVTGKNAFLRSAFVKKMTNFTMFNPYGKMGIYLCICDEFQRISPENQGYLVHDTESMSNTVFIFISTQGDLVIDAIKHRSLYLKINPPSRSESIEGLINIVKKENLHVPNSVLATIVDRNYCNPRRCLIDLETFISFGKLPEQEKIF
jgi:DNA polymerase III subunit gamma/tau